MVTRNEYGILNEPSKPSTIPHSSQWLSGKGAGSWFYMSKNEDIGTYQITRFTLNGIIEFNAEFELNSPFEFRFDCPFVFTYLSHYKSCTVIQHGDFIKFTRILD